MGVSRRAHLHSSAFYRRRTHKCSFRVCSRIPSLEIATHVVDIWKQTSWRSRLSSPEGRPSGPDSPTWKHQRGKTMLSENPFSSFRAMKCRRFQVTPIIENKKIQFLLFLCPPRVRLLFAVVRFSFFILKKFSF